MKLKKELILRKVAATWVVVPLGSKVLSFDGMLRLNESGQMLWNTLLNDVEKEDLVELLIKEYTISRYQAEKDVDEFVEKLIKAGCLE